MASVGHIAVGMAAARVEGRASPSWRAVALWSALSLLPDADVIGFALGVQYADPWGHRGATHSLMFSAVAGAAIGLAMWRHGRRAVRIAALAALILASHAILDTMTDGGLGCALFWPFDHTRYFAPWRPIPVAPIGLRFLSPGVATLVLIELVLFAPVLAYALRLRGLAANRVIAGAALAVWLALVWVIASDSPARNAVVGFVVREDTAYSAGFSEAGFRTLEVGESESDVRRRLGIPFRELWFYVRGNADAAAAASMPAGCARVHFEQGMVVTAAEADACARRGVAAGLRAADVERAIGRPLQSCWQYTWSPGNRRHRLRVVCFTKGSVQTIVRRWE